MIAGGLLAEGQGRGLQGGYPAAVGGYLPPHRLPVVVVVPPEGFDHLPKLAVLLLDSGEAVEDLGEESAVRGRCEKLISF